MTRTLLPFLLLSALSVAAAENYNGLNFNVPDGWTFAVKDGVGFLVNTNGEGQTPPFIMLYPPVPEDMVAGDQFLTVSCPRLPATDEFTVVYPKATLPSNTPGQYIVSLGGKARADTTTFFKSCLGVVSGKRALFLTMITENEGIYKNNVANFWRFGLSLLDPLTGTAPVAPSSPASTGKNGASPGAAPTPTKPPAATLTTNTSGLTLGQIVAQAWGETSGTTLKIPGVSANPDSLDLGEIYNALCPWQCLQYTVGGKFPLVNIHQPFPVSASTMMQALPAALARSPYSRSLLQAVGQLKASTAPDGSKLLMQEFRDTNSRADTRSLVVAIEKQGVTVLVEMRYDGDQDERITELVLYPVLDTLKFDAAAIAKGRQATQQAVNNAPDTVRKAFAAGGKAQIFTRLATTVDTVSPFGGIKYEPRTLILLPGGIAVRNVPEQDFRNINYPQLLGTNPPGQWKQGGNNIVINWGNETETLQARGNGFVSNIDDDTDDFPWNRTATLNTQDLVGTYTYSYISGMGGSTNAGDGRLTLAGNGTYTLTGTRFGGFSGAGVTASSTNNSAESGKWAFDPASYTITFTPQGARAYAVPAFKRGQNECTTQGCAWMIAGQEWKR